MNVENVAELQVAFAELKAGLQEQVCGGGKAPQLSGQIKEIDSAMERLRAGTYGVCCICSLVMPKNDLLRDPFREECSHCRQRGKAGRRKQSLPSH